MIQLPHPYTTPGQTIALSRWTFVDEVMCLLLNMLFRLVMVFLPWSKRLLIFGLQSPSTQENKIWHCFPLFPHLFAKKRWDYASASWSQSGEAVEVLVGPVVWWVVTTLQDRRHPHGNYVAQLLRCPPLLQFSATGMREGSHMMQRSAGDLAGDALGEGQGCGKGALRQSQELGELHTEAGWCGMWIGSTFTLEEGDRR